MAAVTQVSQRPFAIFLEQFEFSTAAGGGKKEMCVEFWNFKPGLLERIADNAGFEPAILGVFHLLHSAATASGKMRAWGTYTIRTRFNYINYFSTYSIAGFMIDAYAQ